MKHYIRALVGFSALCLTLLFSPEKANAENLVPLDDDPMATRYTTEEKSYNSPSVDFIMKDGSKLTHSDRFDGAKIRTGIDVSYYQGDIDWNAVKSSGVEFVIIRVGYRGLSTGILNNDTKFTTYMQGALAADLKVGVYFFSQAITPAEAEEEADFVLARIAGYNISLPVAIDYEYGGSDGGRIYNANLSKEAATQICSSFCNRVASAGYKPMVYANKSMLENKLDGVALGNAFDVWLAHYTDKTSYANNYSFWQYTSDGYVNGISGRVDMDIWYDTSGMILVGSENAKKYVTRLFNAFLERDPDPTGLATYTKALTEGDLTASRLVTTLMESGEYKSKRYSDEDFIKKVYQGMLGRSATDADVKALKSYLDNGVSRRFILSVIANSQEFVNLCNSYKMEKGYISVTENRDRCYDYTAYVMRCYDKLFGRKADVSGLNTWTGSILNGGGGVSVVCSLINSDEFRMKRYSNSECVERIYQAMLGRGSDPAGKTHWVNVLNQGPTPLVIVQGFCGSDEFKNLCKKYNMTPGSVTLTEPRDQNVFLTGFVTRCYQTALQRNPDATGLNNWCYNLLNRLSTPEDVAYGFVFSPEACTKFPGNEAYVEMLYRLCLGRGSDPVGKSNWMATLNNGTPRYTVFWGFTHSDEFHNIVRSYGL